MKVYLVQDGCYEDKFIDAVFLKREDAVEYIGFDPEVRDDEYHEGKNYKGLVPCDTSLWWVDKKKALEIQAKYEKLAKTNSKGDRFESDHVEIIEMEVK